MKKIAIIILAILWIGNIYGQTDKNGNTVFNSVSTSKQKDENFLLIGNYYTLKNNINNNLSSVYISENPTLDQIENAAINLSSDFYILTKERKMVVMVILQNTSKREFQTIIMKTNKQSSFPCTLTGDITENRAKELITDNYDPTAVIEDDNLTFNGKVFKIISNQQIEDAVWKLIKEEKLKKKKPSNLMLLSTNEIKNYIISETQVGGELDFFTEIIGNEYDGVQIKQGIVTTRHSIALYKWGRACFEIGVNTVDDAFEIFSEFKGESVSSRNREYIRMGFNKEWEKETVGTLPK